MKEQINLLCQKIKESNKLIYITATGAGAGIQDLLWQIPGISSVLVGANFPYAHSQTNQFLGFEPISYASLATAVDLAQTSYKRIYEEGKEVVGLGLSAAVSTSHERRGKNRIHIAVITKNGCKTLTAIIPDETSRAKDGEIADFLAISFLALGCGIENDIFMTIKKEYGINIQFNREDNDLSRERFLTHPYFDKNGKRHLSMDVPFSNLILFPGSFRPAHWGHLGMASKFNNSSNFQFIFEISVDCLHKDSLTVPDMLQRAKGLEGQNLIFTEGCPLYIDKAKRFPGATFVLGSDSLQRMFDPKWCTNPDTLVEEFRTHQIKFIVFGRQFGGHWNDLFTIQRQYPAIKKLNATGMKGNWEVSSTEIRAKTASTMLLSAPEIK